MISFIELCFYIADTDKVKRHEAYKLLSNGLNGDLDILSGKRASCTARISSGIQLGAILAVAVLFWNQIFPFKKHCRQPMKKTGLLSSVDRDILILWVKILIVSVPAGVTGVLFDEVFDQLFYNPFSVAAALIVFGIAFIVIENARRHTRPQVTSLNELTLKPILFIGIFQLIAGIFPGTSRSGATIAGALLIGIDRSTAAEFTFFLAIPVMFGASLLN